MSYSNSRGSYGQGRGGYRGRDDRQDHNQRPSFGRGGGGGRGGRGFDNTPRPTECTVSVNYNKLILMDPSKQVDWIQYKVEIKDGRWVFQGEEGGGEKQRTFVSSEHPVGADEKQRKRFFSSPKPWRIFNKLLSDEQVKDPSFIICYDGGDMAVAPISGAQETIDGREFRVCIKRDCEEDHPDANKVSNQWFIVTFKKTNLIQSSSITSVVNGDESNSSTESLSMAINIIFKTISIYLGMLPLAPNSSTVLFPLSAQANLFHNRVPEADHGKKCLLSGVKQLAISSSSGCFIQTDPIVNWFDKESFELSRNGAKIPLIDRRSSEIAGVRVSSVSRISERERDDISSVLSKLSFNVEYKIEKPDAKREEEMLRRGKTKQEIDESRRRILMNQTIKLDPETNSKIKWSPLDHSFLLSEDERMVTVAQYFAEKYGIELDPNLPIVYLGKKKGWFPLQFCYQSFAKTRDANGDQMVQAVLKHYDTIAGTELIGDIKRKQELISGMQRFGKRFDNFLGMYNLRVDNSPTNIKARVLLPPRIQFDGKNVDCKNGSFNLMNVKFAKPAEMNSFVVADFSRDGRSCNEYVMTQLKVNGNHGIIIPESTKIIANRHFNDIAAQCNPSSNDPEGACVREAIAQGRNVYFCDSLNIYRGNHVWFKTTSSSNGREHLDCLILPPQGREGDIGLMFDVPNPSSSLYFTHGIELKGGDRTCDTTRLKVKIQETSNYLDPFDVRFGPEGKMQAVNNGIWRDVHFSGYCFECHLTNGSIAHVDEGEVDTMTYLHVEREGWRITPPIVISYLPDKGKALYDKVKFYTNQCVGTQSQCCVRENFNKQRNKDQFASNIATKMNTKLSSSVTKAESWKSSFDGDDGVVWVSECPTLVIGIGMAHGMGGRQADTVIGASVCLDKGCMRLSHSCYLQKKSDTISKFTMRDIVAESWDRFCLDNGGCIPQRVLIYRDGMSEGNFNKADDEIAYVRETLKSKTDGCPPITFVICQSQHSVRMVPTDENQGYRVGRGGVNVHSGTSVDHTIMELGTLLTITDDDISSIRASNDPNRVVFGEPMSNSYDFLLTAQGGLKGTSKPIYYRVRLNENAVWGPRGTTPLTKPNLQNCTHQLCYKYGSATKAVREVPVIKYAKKLANQVLGTLKYLRDGGTAWDGKTLRLECPHDDMEDDNDERPYIVSLDGIESKQHNIIPFSFHNHLAA